MSAVITPQRWPVTRSRSGRPLVYVLAADPELAALLDPSERDAAVTASVALEVKHSRGPWEFAPPPGPGGLGILVLDGLIVARTVIGGRANAELLGPGDVISPWVGVGPELPLPTEISSCALSDLRLALLSRQFARATARWPEIHAALFHRLITRSRRLSLQSAINAIPRIDERLELTLWVLAYRFATVTSTGLRLRLGLTHVQLAEVIAAQRPSVTVALSRLEARGRLIRYTGEWLLQGPEPPAFAALARQSGLRG